MNIQLLIYRIKNAIELQQFKERNKDAVDAEFTEDNNNVER